MGMVGTAAEELALFQMLKAGGRFAGHDRGRLRRRRSDWSSPNSQNRPTSTATQNVPRKRR